MTPLAKVSDGVVVGSALVNRIAELQNEALDIENSAAKVSELTQEIKTALNQL